ncbi:hypothetical protein LYSHEL_00150 [Lysobacter helvus]|uniref:CAAX prenyl protease 2/Lysostaphin resistance protein A-like domain-containing protein n=2 Tax=Lysobacteraceae TaxID=32033 RepID=A0ABM7Q1D4_9GAMM|nr:MULTISPECIES: type II CAAX endopeptidase family protein [Lysobacter]BCT90991.1 hypothetical protein LYSCAS_00150 [Lysobacter caseinilyticus]BCT94144.1 hypothetical protein LYSHEL_00150 [Lysobacter helvus]
MQAWVARALVALVGVAGWSGACAQAPTPEQQFAQVRAEKSAAYQRVVADYDARIAAAPEDRALQIARCQFMAVASRDEEDYMESAYDDEVACETALAKRWPGAPEVDLFVLQHLYGDESVKKGEALLKTAQDWPDALRRELLVAVSDANSNNDLDHRAGELALQATHMGDARVVSRAVSYLQGKGKSGEAVALLRTAAVPESDFEKGRRIDAALALPDKQAAARELRRWKATGYAPDPEQLVRVSLRAGDVATARMASRGIPAGRYGQGAEPLRFDVALAARDYTRAASLIEPAKTDQLRETFRRFVALLKASPASIFQPRMLIVATMFSMLFVPLLLVPGLMLLPVHYRGLVRRMDGRASTPLFAPIGLWHSWYAGAVLIVFSFVGAFAAVNSDGRLVVDGQLDSTAVFRMAAWGTGFGLLCMLFVARLLWRRALVGDAAMWRATWTRIVGAWAVLLVIGVLIGVFNHAVGFDVDTEQTKMVRALAGAGHSVGQWAVLVVVAMLAPVFEELVFRGALLGGLSRHISFGWANVWQAALFAAIHGDPPRLPYYFAMGLFGGWLVKRTGSLAPAIALHMLNNAVAMGLMLAFTA